MRLLLTFAMVLCMHISANAETIEWTPGATIDTPVAVSRDDARRTRVIEFPAQIREATCAALEKDLGIKKNGNRLILQLLNPAYEASIQVYDIDNNLYLLNVRSPIESETPDDALIITRGHQPGASGTTETKIVNNDTDGAQVHLMAEMVGGVRDPAVRWTSLTSVERGTVKQGRTIFSDDNLTITVIKAYRAPTLFGYECLAYWHGEQSVTLNVQRLWFPGVLSVHVSDQAVLPQQDPQIILPKDRAIRLYYVTEAGE